jgi:arylsulfatase A-like enzyme
MKNQSLFILPLALLLASTAVLHAADAPAKKPNVIIILADDLGWADVGWQGGKIKTPNLDRLAKEGVILDQFYTQPQCTPTRTALLTGRYPLRYGMHYGVVLPYSTWGLPKEALTLPELLRREGYRTGMVGKWHQGHHTPEMLPECRFDHFFGCYKGSLDYFAHRFPNGSDDLHRNGQTVREEGYATFLFARESARFIETAPQDRPFFLYLAFNAPHTPLQAPPASVEKYKDLGATPRATYAGMIDAMDEAVGTVLDALEKSGRRDQTLILFASDNGGESVGKISDNGPLRREKGTSYEGGIRVPAFANWPGHIQAGRRTSQLMHAVDILPTVLEIAGAPPRTADDTDGLSMAPALLADRAVARPAMPIVSGPENFWNALRDGDWKLVTIPVPEHIAPDGNYSSSRVELYRISDDPYEKRDLTAAEPARVAAMRASLKAWFDRTVPSEFSLSQAKPPRLQDTVTRSNTILAGTWRFELDAKDLGEKERWFARDLADKIPLPGTTDEAKKGTGVVNGQTVESIHPQLLAMDRSSRFTSHLSRRFPYDGAAWYQREIEIPESWQGKRVVFRIERTKLSAVWLDDVCLGQQDSLTVEHVYALPETLSFGKHRLTVRIDNRLEKLHARGHQVSDDTQTNWNGLLGELCLEATDRLWIEDVAVYPDAAGHAARVRVTLGNETKHPAKGRLALECSAKGVSVKGEVTFAEARDGRVIETQLQLGAEAPLWNEFNPALHRLIVMLEADKGEKDRRETHFGLRDFSTRGTQFTLNGKAVLLRGKHDACVFPLTGYAPMDKASWLAYFKTCRDYGMNHVRFHTWCPPRAAFEAADETGFLLQPELANFGGNLGTDNEKRRYSMAEAHRMLRHFGNSPSFALFALGNENFKGQTVRAEMIRELRAADPRHLYTQVSNPDFDVCLQNGGDDFWVTFRSKPGLEGNIRGSYSHADLPLGTVQTGPAHTLHDYAAAIRHVTCPLVSHEVGQYQVYPDFREISKYLGTLRAVNFEIFRDRLATAGMLEQAHDFFRASGALAVINYREEVEAALRTPGMGGFQLLDLQDFPGQGTALVGILNAFMESKGLITPEAWRGFCDAIVVLAKFPKYTWRAGETFTAEALIANYGPSDLPQTSITYAMTDATGQAWCSGSVSVQATQGQVTPAGKRITFELPKEIKRAEKLTLTVKIEGTALQNQYPLWVYPAMGATATALNGVNVVRQFNAATREALARGERIVFIPEKAAFPTNSIEGFFASDFWCYPMFRSIALHHKKPPAPGTLGLLIQEGHPALASFPTAFHSDYQWFDIVMNSCGVILDTAPKGFKPIVQVIDNFDRNHRLGLIFEAKVGAGRLLVCAVDLNALKDKPEAACLLDSLLRYASSDAFAPQTDVDPDTLGKLLTGER